MELFFVATLNCNAMQMINYANDAFVINSVSAIIFRNKFPVFYLFPFVCTFHYKSVNQSGLNLLNLIIIGSIYILTNND